MCKAHMKTVVCWFYCSEAKIMSLSTHTKNIYFFFIFIFRFDQKTTKNRQHTTIDGTIFMLHSSNKRRLIDSNELHASSLQQNLTEKCMHTINCRTIRIEERMKEQVIKSTQKKNRNIVSNITFCG